MNRNRRFRRSLLLIFLLVWVAPVAHAVPMVETDMGGTNATAIRNLQFLGNLYDVEFVEDIALSDDVYGTPPEFDFNLPDVVDGAIEAVNMALNDVDEVVTVGEGESEYRIGYLVSDPGISTVEGRYDNPTADWVAGEFEFVALSSVETWAVFTVVPEPGTTLLLGLGLTGLSAASRSRRRATRETAFSDSPISMRRFLCSKRAGHR